MGKLVETKVRCPKCKSKDLILVEVGTWSSEFKVTCGKFDRQEGFHEPGSVDRLEATCSSCKHQWKVRGAGQIDDAVYSPSAGHAALSRTKEG